MFDLIYPLDMPPVLPPRRAGDAAAVAPEPGRKEMFPVVDPSGLVTGMASRQMKKDIQPGKWDTAVGGHVDYGEMLLEALYREASEELGFKEFNPVYLCSYVFESRIEKELVNVFASVGAFTLSPDRDEVDEGRWWEMDEIERSIGMDVMTPNFEQEFVRIKKTLLALL